MIQIIEKIKCDFCLDEELILESEFHIMRNKIETEYFFKERSRIVSMMEENGWELRNEGIFCIECSKFQL